jgi:2-deoxy-D-gluconate 3-dehydrogenase
LAPSISWSTTRAQYAAPAAEYPQTYWDEIISVNLTSVFRLSQLAGQDMLKRGTKGKILNIASLLSFQGGITVRLMQRPRAAWRSSPKRWRMNGLEGHQR